MTTKDKDVSAHLLIVDDDREILKLLKYFFSTQGYRVTSVQNGKEMKKALEDWSIDLIILDLMLPGEDGLTLCRDLRVNSKIPIIMLTAMGEEMDRIIGLEMGADDYLSKPFHPRELLARTKAVLRRFNGLEQSIKTGGMPNLNFSGWTVQRRLRRLISPKNLVVDLTDGEFNLLLAFVEHPQQTLSRDQLLDLTQGRVETPFDRSIDMQVSRLRKKIEVDPTKPELIKTVRGGGYLFTSDVAWNDAHS